MNAIFLTALFFAASAALAGVYSYRDEKGTLHAVSNPQDIPEKFRGKERKLAGAESGTGVVDLKLQRQGGSLLIPVTFGDAGEYLMILDTGASVTMISTQVADKVKPKVVDKGTVATASGLIQVPIVEMPEMSVKQFTVSKMRITVNNLPGPPNGKIHGLLGVDFLNHFRMQLDTETGQLHLERK